MRLAPFTVDCLIKQLERKETLTMAKAILQRERESQVRDFDHKYRLWDPTSRP